MKLASFDIFDTTLIRKCGKPESIFLLLAHRLYPTDAAKQNAFLIWRSGSRGRVHNRQTGNEYTLEDIYADDYLKGFREYTPQQLMETEMSTEKDSLIPNPDIIDKITDLRNNGYQIAFISDMYLPSSFLQNILSEYGIFTESDKIYVSCEENARKDTGHLYKKVRAELKPEKWIHFGDNRRSDYKMALNNGIEAHLVDYGFNDSEKFLMSSNAGSSHHDEIAILAGYSRAWRIINRNNPYAEIAGVFTAAVYIPYVKWIIEQARIQGIKRLYFLSRDGYILMKIAESLNVEDIQLRYLFVSRKSLTPGFMADFTQDNLLDISDGHSIVRKDVNSILSLLQTSREELGRYGIELPHGNKIQSKKEQETFLNGIFNSNITDVLKERACKSEETLIQYFRQEGLFDDTKSAMVDVGWLGTSRLMVNSILNRNGHSSIPSFYFGVRKDVLSPSAGDYMAYFMPDMVGYQSMPLIENYFSSSPYQTTRGYKENDGKIVPIFKGNKDFCHSAVSLSNMNACEWIASEIAKTNIFSDEALSLWAKTSLDTLTDLKASINLEPFANTANFDNIRFVKKLTVREAIDVTLLGKMTTAFDRGSLHYTFGRKFGNRLDRLSSITGRIRHHLFLRLRTHK